jgi:hypothetical protein
MKKIIFMLAINLIAALNIYAQHDFAKYFTSVQYGYMAEFCPYYNKSDVSHGKFLSFEVEWNKKRRNDDFEKKTKKKDLSVGFSFTKGTTNRLIPIQGYQTQLTPTNFDILGIVVNKEVRRGDKSSIILGIGLSYLLIQETHTELFVDQIYGGIKSTSYNSYINDDIGLILSFKYLYELNRNVELGIQIKSLHSSSTSPIKALMIAPTLRFKIY